MADIVEGKVPFGFETELVEIQIPGRSAAHANVFESHFSSGSAARLVIRGNSPYPAKPRVQQVDLIDVVGRIIRETGVDVNTAEVEEVTRRLQHLLKRSGVSGLSIFNLSDKYDTAFRVKAACQEAALVTAPLLSYYRRRFCPR